MRKGQIVLLLLFLMSCNPRVMKETLAEWKGERIPPPDAFSAKDYFPKSFSIPLTLLEEKEMVNSLEGIVLENYASTVRRKYTLAGKMAGTNPIIITTAKFYSEEAARGNWYRFTDRLADYIPEKTNYVLRRGKTYFLTLEEPNKRIIVARLLAWALYLISVPVELENARQIVETLDSDFLQHFSASAKK
ncbi:MAG: hypothetical protein V2G48_00065 [bacterium JZ-2024 1]